MLFFNIFVILQKAKTCIIVKLSKLFDCKFKTKMKGKKNE